jgi:uncharacterized protein (TIGR03435 family)
MLKSRLLGAVGIVAVVGGIASVVTAQAPTSPTFEVASIKPSGPPTFQSAGATGWLAGGRYVVRQTNLLNLLGIAYRPSGPGSLGIDHIDASHVSSWVSSARFDIEARASDAPAGWGTDAVNQPYLRSLLDERFKLKVHFEKRDLPIYWMLLTSKDGTLAPTVKRTGDLTCDEITRMRRENPAAIPPAPPGGTVPCTVRLGGDRLDGSFVTMALFAGALRGPVGAPVIDRTNLAGMFAIDVHFTRDSGAALPAADAASIPEWPPLMTALQDQLGLKLERHVEAQDVLVIDHVEQPTPD